MTTRPSAIRYVHDPATGYLFLRTDRDGDRLEIAFRQVGAVVHLDDGLLHHGAAPEANAYKDAYLKLCRSRGLQSDADRVYMLLFDPGELQAQTLSRMLSEDGFAAYAGRQLLDKATRREAQRQRDAGS